MDFNAGDAGVTEVANFVSVSFALCRRFPTGTLTEHRGPEELPGQVIALTSPASGQPAIPLFYRRSVRCPSLHRRGYGG